MSAAPVLPPPYRILETHIRGYALAFPEERDRAVEAAAFPDMVSIYRGLVDGHIPPFQGTFAEEVSRRMRGFSKSAVRARACRAYPSFVRQHHAVLVLREHFPVVAWDRWLDQLQGVDVLVVDHRGLAAGLVLSTETKLARDWSAVKDNRHARPTIPILEAFAGAGEYQVGAFWLHDPAKLVEQLQETMAGKITQTLAALEVEAGEVYRSSERRPKCSRQDFEAGVRGAVAYIKRRLLDSMAGA